MNSSRKILTKTQLQEKLKEHRALGQTVALANGCFDILHVGHVRYLKGAKKEADVLVAAINSDASVGPLKGSGRPILPQQSRAALVAALRPVDYVVIFDEPNVEKLLSDLRPDVHAKGTDYSVSNVPERETSKRLGIRIAIVGDEKQHATRSLLARVRDSADPQTNE
jgi:D-glycero-beta-D-manno-heptose 1-phosphate adenylyltransferase